MNVTIKNATLNFGSTVHAGLSIDGKKLDSVLCGAEFSKSQSSRMATITETDHEVTCSRCAKKLPKVKKFYESLKG